jgi:hypothetical protein
MCLLEAGWAQQPIQHATETKGRGGAVGQHQLQHGLLQLQLQLLLLVC